MSNLRPVPEHTAAWAARHNAYASNQLQLHRPSPASGGRMTCAESCRKGNNGAGDVQEWPGNSATMALAEIEETKRLLNNEARSLDQEATRA